jgi:capsular exopolysaccharide synthesis family protein
MSDKDLAKAISETIKLENLTTIHAADQNSEGSEIHIPDVKKISSKLVVHHQPTSMESEYFRFLKAKLEHIFDDDPAAQDIGRVILVTGAARGSGKTTCALNLALSFARAYGNRALFLDGDSRHNASQMYMGLGKKPLAGLSEVLTMQQRAGSVLINTGLSDLVFFPSGSFSEAFIDRLRSEELAILINSLKKKFRYVIIDAPPAFPMPEPGILAKHSDGVLLVLRAGKDGQNQLEQALEAMGGNNILGVLLNGIKPILSRRYGYNAYYSKVK